MKQFLFSVILLIYFSSDYTYAQVYNLTDRIYLVKSSQGYITESVNKLDYKH